MSPDEIPAAIAALNAQMENVGRQLATISNQITSLSSRMDAKFDGHLLLHSQEDQASRVRSQTFEQRMTKLEANVSLRSWVAGGVAALAAAAEYFSRVKP